MSLGVCSCQTGKDGTPCKHQYVLWMANVAHCINFIPVTNPDSRQKLAWIALRSCDVGGQKELAQGDGLPSEASTIMGTTHCSTTVEIENPDSPADVIETAEHLLQTSCMQILQKLQTTILIWQKG